MAAKRKTSTDLAIPLDPWDKMPGETVKAFEACHYRDSSPQERSLRITAQHLIDTSPAGSRSDDPDQVKRHVAEWSSRYHWVERVEAFTIAEDRRRRLERQALQRTIEERHMDAASQMQFAALARMRGLPAREGREAVAALSPNEIETWGELARVFDISMRAQRLTIGLPTDLTKGIDSFSYNEVLGMVSDLIDFALEDMPEERHERFLVRTRDRLSQPRR